MRVVEGDTLYEEGESFRPRTIQEVAARERHEDRIANSFRPKTQCSITVTAHAFSNRGTPLGVDILVTIRIEITGVPHKRTYASLQYARFPLATVTVFRTAHTRPISSVAEPCIGPSILSQYGQTETDGNNYSSYPSCSDIHPQTVLNWFHTCPAVFIPHS